MIKIGRSEVRISMVIKLAGAFCAFLIGAGFATGQEIMQYFTNYGIGKAIGVMTINALLGAWTSAAVMNLGNESKDVQGLECYKNLCGKYVGTLLSWFVPLFMFLTLMTMMAGFGSTFNQVFGGPEWLGSLILAVVVTLVVLLGLASVIDTIGFIGPTIIVVTMVMAIGVIAKHGVDFANWNHYITTHDVLLASSSWVMAGILYALWNIVMCLPFMSAMGSKAKNKTEVVTGVVLGNVLFAAGGLCLVLAEGSQIDLIADISVPALAMAQSLSPILGVIYAVVLALAIFTTAVPLMWSVAARLTKEKTMKFAIVCVIIAVLGFFGSYLPFETLVNIVTPAVGYVGLIGWLFIIWRDIKLVKAALEKRRLPMPKDGE
ncbi:hypothetical protein [Hominibacterium faecale]|uniref:YkvI family membrane protein n=1 Tax=Hominibacterium faecale TaxID=2839743 RepID=UPI0022B29DD1|nr:hypothetical protein [Hominibacterium faecale]